jgi:hypothetical protein
VHVISYSRVFTQVFKKKRTHFNFEMMSVVEMMLQCNGGRPDEGWRKEEGYWGHVLTKCGLGNTKLHRKKLYMAWKRNMNNFQDTFFERVKKCSRNEV